MRMNDTMHARGQGWVLAHLAPRRAAGRIRRRTKAMRAGPLPPPCRLPRNGPKGAAALQGGAQRGQPQQERANSN